MTEIAEYMMERDTFAHFIIAISPRAVYYLRRVAIYSATSAVVATLGMRCNLIRVSASIRRRAL